MSKTSTSRRDFIKNAGIAAGAVAAGSVPAVAMADSATASMLSKLLGASDEPEPEPEAAPETTGQPNYLQIFADYLDAEGVLYTLNEENGTISIGYAADNVDGIWAKVYYDDESPILTVVSWDLGNVGTDPTNIAGAILACNEMNNTYRWVKFSVDKDNDFACRVNAYVDERTCGPISLALVKRLIEIMDAAWPTLSPYTVA